MSKELKLLKNNDNRELPDIEWVNEFYKYLQGDQPEGQAFKKFKLSKKQAFAIIWYLQEHFPLIPDHIEQCSVCGELFDSWATGHHSELTGKHYCSEYCEPPGLYEKEQRAEERAAKRGTSS